MKIRCTQINRRKDLTQGAKAAEFGVFSSAPLRSLREFPPLLFHLCSSDFNLWRNFRCGFRSRGAGVNRAVLVRIGEDHGQRQRRRGQKVRGAPACSSSCGELGPVVFGRGVAGSVGGEFGQFVFQSLMFIDQKRGVAGRRAANSPMGVKLGVPASMDVTRQAVTR